MTKYQIGHVFGQLTFLEKRGDPKGNRRWLCRCTCGDIREYFACNLSSGNTKSCGCTAEERMGLGNLTHGHTRKDVQSGVYMSWRKMRERINFPQFNPHYIGVTICDRWQKFENFLEDMGERPEGCSLDRIDSNGNYEPSNCRWATDAQQSQNRKPWKHTPEGLLRINAER